MGPTLPDKLPGEMRPMAKAIVAEMNEPMHRLQQLGLGYLSLDRAGSTLSNGELQRVQLARAVRTRTTGVLYVLDEPSIGLHPSNVEGLLGVIDDLMGDGNSVVVVDHDLSVLRATDYIVGDRPRIRLKRWSRHRPGHCRTNRGRPGFPHRALSLERKARTCARTCK